MMARSISVSAVLLLVLGVAYVQGQVVIETVTVGDPGNAPDDQVMETDGTTGYGGVAYTYNIGKYEVTNAQYAEFLNAVAASDPHGLYNTDMGGGYGGITHSGPAGSYTYSAIEGRENMPVNYVSWYDTLRFANWMHNGQGNGDTEDGAYDMSLGSSVVRKPGALVALPSEDEWYKAAFYEGGGRCAGYWGYPTQSDMWPAWEAPPGTDMINGSANYYWAVGDLTDVGSYTFKPSDSPYGTFDQAGNLWEWNEAVTSDSYRGIRGGSFEMEDYYMHAAQRMEGSLTIELHSVGFRVSEVSEHAPVPEDLDHDGDVDLHDYALWQRAFAGPR